MLHLLYYKGVFQNVPNKDRVFEPILVYKGNKFLKNYRKEMNKDGKF